MKIVEKENRRNKKSLMENRKGQVEKKKAGKGREYSVIYLVRRLFRQHDSVTSAQRLGIPSERQTPVTAEHGKE